MSRLEVPDPRWSRAGAPLAAQAVANRTPAGAPPSFPARLAGRPTAPRRASMSASSLHRPPSASWLNVFRRQPAEIGTLQIEQAQRYSLLSVLAIWAAAA